MQNYVGDKDANTELSTLFDKNGNLDDAKLIAELEADRDEFQKKYGLSDEELDLAARDLYESQEQRKQSGGETSGGNQPSAVEGSGVETKGEEVASSPDASILKTPIPRESRKTTVKVKTVTPSGKESFVEMEAGAAEVTMKKQYRALEKLLNCL